MKKRAGNHRTAFRSQKICLLGQCVMGRCHNGSSICLQCQMTLSLTLSRTSGLSLRNSFWTILFLLTKIFIDLIFSLLIPAFFGRGEFAVCHYSLCLLVSNQKNLLFITWDHRTKEIILTDDYVKKIKSFVFSIVWLRPFVCANVQ